MKGFCLPLAFKRLRLIRGKYYILKMVKIYICKGSIQLIHLNHRIVHKVYEQTEMMNVHVYIIIVKVKQKVNDVNKQFVYME